MVEMDLCFEKLLFTSAVVRCGGGVVAKEGRRFMVERRRMRVCPAAMTVF
jgi:hypothetical protein